MNRPRFILGDTPWRATFEWCFAILCLTYLIISAWGLVHAGELFQSAPPGGIRAASEVWIHQSAGHYRIGSIIGVVASTFVLIGLFSRGRARAFAPIGVGILPISKLIFLVLG